MSTGTDGIVTWTCTRIQLIDALAALPLGGYLTLEARGRFADCILGQLPVASDAGFYMEGVKAERERIAELAEKVDAFYDAPCPDGVDDCVHQDSPFADLIREEPQP